MTDAFDEVAFLANSQNRLAVLDALVDGPRSRHVLAEVTGVSRVTLGRIVDELAGRHWIVQRGQVCEITPLGEWVRAEFSGLLETMAAERVLRRVYRWFPDGGFPFGIDRLAGAEITLVSRAEASAPISRLAAELEAGGRFRAFSFAITGQFLAACHRLVVGGDGSWEWAFTPEVRSVLEASPTMARQSAEMLETGRAAYRVVEEEIPYVVVLSESRVNLRLADDGGAATALLQTDDATVRSWAASTFADYWERGRPVGAEAFTA